MEFHYKNHFSCDDLSNLPEDYQPSAESMIHQRSSSPVRHSSLQNVNDETYAFFESNLLKPAKAFKIRGTNLKNAGIISGNLKEFEFSMELFESILWDQIESRVDSTQSSTDLECSDQELDFQKESIVDSPARRLRKAKSPSKKKFVPLFTRMKRAISTALTSDKKKKRPAHTYDTVCY